MTFKLLPVGHSFVKRLPIPVTRPGEDIDELELLIVGDHLDELFDGDEGYVRQPYRHLHADRVSMFVL